MSLRLLLDENIAPTVARQIQRKEPTADIESVFTWQGRTYVGAPDPVLLAAARQDKRTLITYDTQMLSEWSDLLTGEIPFSGVVFIDDRTIPSSDFGGLVRAILGFWEREAEADWTDRIAFLTAAT
jgi:predicted nuclease of predicted toxin-antitoxin system